MLCVQKVTLVWKHHNIKNTSQIKYDKNVLVLTNCKTMSFFQERKTEDDIDNLTKNLSQVSLRGQTALGN